MNNQSYDKRQQNVDDRQQQFKNNKRRKMFCKKMIVLRDVNVVEICYAEIENDVQHEGKVKQRKVQPEAFCMHCILPVHIYEKHMKRLNKQIQ